ncbi:MAG: hypothetical protein WDM91_11590 [Rhizomicrobium sp.]
MTAIVPLNIAALRVSLADNTQIAPNFKGRTAVFEKIPWVADATTASTGDAIARPLEDNDSPAETLDIGVHLHWELPDFFRRGSQLSAGGPVVFPQVPNRWLVIRYFSLFQDGGWSAPTAAAFLVESDYLAVAAPSSPCVSVPLTDASTQQPYLYMGRQRVYGPATGPAQFLPDYNDEDGNPCMLTSVGFVGPGFSSFYPECSSVFGFFDDFSDQSIGNGQNVGTVLAAGSAIHFKASYQVIGWIDPTGTDPLAGLQKTVTEAWTAYATQCSDQGVAPTLAPSDILDSIVTQQFGWQLQGLDPTQSIAGLAVPSQTLVAGIMQELVWDTAVAQQNGGFLASTSTTTPAVWRGQGEVAIGNTTTEALSALLRNDLAGAGAVPAALDDYEYLLNALQLGLVQNVENGTAHPAQMDEDLHGKAFATEFGGWIWELVQPSSPQGQAPEPGRAADLQDDIAALLAALNAAQKAYDQDRFSVELQRKQLFMDWYRYVTMFFTIDPNQPAYSFEELTNFLDTNGPCELNAVQGAGNQVGLLQYKLDGSGNAVAPAPPASTTSFAGAVYGCYASLVAALTAPGWSLRAVPAPSFCMPTDPVLLAEGSQLQRAQRNGPGPTIAVRTSGQLLTTLAASGSEKTTDLPNLSWGGLTTVLAGTPAQADVQALITEAVLLIPMLATVVQQAMAAVGGDANPATASPADFVAALQAAQGGLSPQDGGPGAGLFAWLRAPPPSVAPNPSQSVDAPMALTFTWSNAGGTAYPPDPVGWMAQCAVPNLSASRSDPFLPIFMIWNAWFSPLQMQGKDANSWPAYSAGNLTQFFTLDDDGADYAYVTSNGFTQPADQLYGYSGSAALSTRAAYSLGSQIQAYLNAFPSDTEADPSLQVAQAAYNSRNFVSQAMSGLGAQQIQQAFLPQIPVENLVSNPGGQGVDLVTSDISAAALLTGDNWYDGAFNAVKPLSAGRDFGPLRAGFLALRSLQIVDVFGQTMQFATGAGSVSLTPVVAASLQPNADDVAHQGQAYLPPRLLTPTRLWFRWLSARTFGDTSASVVESNSHPATSPVCGWLMPNDLNDSLFFYDADGSSIGSIGIEHGAVVYRTAPGNLEPYGTPITTDTAAVNPFLSQFMNHVYGQSTGFVQDLLTAIVGAAAFSQPAGSAQDAALAVLLGRPLAIVRCTLGLETSGNLLPLSQDNSAEAAPFTQDVLASAASPDPNNPSQRQQYSPAQRQQYSTAALGAVQFPARLGDPVDMNDGLIGYFVEQTPGGAYGSFYSQAAPAEGGNGVVQPSAADPALLLTLNAPTTLTMLVDPRTQVHATTGVLPVVSLSIPPDQYSSAMSKLAATFFTAPVLSPASGLAVPLPQENGYDWSWIAPGASAPISLSPDAVTENAVFGYSPQTVLEGWLDLTPDPAT